MSWLNDMFGVNKPIFAMLHLQPLPGDPQYAGEDVSVIVDKARKDLHALQDGGVDGIIVSNEFSLPYPRSMSIVTPATMAYVIGNLRDEIRVPFGVDAISDGKATIELAAAVGADFARGTFSGIYVGDGGLYNNDFSVLLRRKKELGHDFRMLYFLNPESDMNLDTRPLPAIARSLKFKANPDGYCISASAAGQDVNDDLIREVKEAVPDVVVICNTGCRNDTIEAKLAYADAAVVGTTFKVDGDLYRPVDRARVESFMEVVRKIRDRQAFQ